MAIVCRAARFRESIRWNDWFDTKLAYLGTACYYLALTNRWTLAHTLTVMVRVFPFVGCLAAFGYVLNDYWDRTADVATRKRSPESLLPQDSHRRLVMALFGGTLLATLPLATSLLGVGVSLGLVTLTIAYSTPPIQLKTRGWLGVIGAAVAQWSSPLLPLLVAGGAFSWGFALLATLGLSMGLRWILLHQILDAASDARSGTMTFTRAHGVPLSTSFIRALVALEAGALAGWALVGRDAAQVLGVATVVYVAGFALVAVRLHRAGQVHALVLSYDLACFRGLYLAWFPLGFLILLAWSEPAYLMLVPVELFWKRHHLIDDLRLVFRTDLARIRRTNGTPCGESTRRTGNR